MRCAWLLLGVLLVGCGRPGGPPAPPVTEISPQSADMATKDGPPQFSDGDWPQWRGPNADGVDTGPAVPATWKDGETPENIVWKAPIAGRGHSSPIIYGDRVLVETADEKSQMQGVVCLSRTTGEQLWRTNIFQGGFEKAMHDENTQASSTLACDGKYVFATFLNDRRIWLVALSLDGQEIWRKELGGFTSKFGFSSSPMLYQSLVIIAADHQSGGFLVGATRDHGSIAWRKKRPAEASYASPRIVTLGGKDQVVICGCKQVTSYDPISGDELWSTPGTASAAVGTPVVVGDLVLASGGYPDRDTVALKPDGQVAWRNSEKSYVPSLLAYDGHLYMVNDDGVAYCYEALTGQERWKKRIGGNFRTSPALNGGHIFTTDMRGKTTVFKADPAAFQVVGENQLGTESFASPAFSRGQMFLRVADDSQGARQDWIYRIGKK